MIPPDLTPLYDSLNEVREALGMARVGQGGELLKAIRTEIPAQDAQKDGE